LLTCSPFQAVFKGSFGVSLGGTGVSALVATFFSILGTSVAVVVGCLASHNSFILNLAGVILPQGKIVSILGGGVIGLCTLPHGIARGHPHTVLGNALFFTIKSGALLIIPLILAVLPTPVAPIPL
jgi:hypothetical protein